MTQNTKSSKFNKYGYDISKFIKVTPLVRRELKTGRLKMSKEKSLMRNSMKNCEIFALENEINLSKMPFCPFCGCKQTIREEELCRWVYNSKENPEYKLSYNIYSSYDSAYKELSELVKKHSYDNTDDILELNPSKDKEVYRYLRFYDHD